MKSPYFDNHFYWLAGELYTFNGWFGAQLTSFQWTHPRPQERRELSGYRFAPFNSYRRRGRVMVTWSCETLPSDTAEALTYLKKMEHDIGNVIVNSKGRL